MEKFEDFKALITDTHKSRAALIFANLTPLSHSFMYDVNNQFVEV